MSIKDKKRILTDYYRKHGGLPKGNLDIQHYFLYDDNTTLLHYLRK